MKRLLLFSLLSTLAFALFSQSVGINPTGNNPDPSAMLDVQAIDKGMLLPRMTTSQRDAITNPAEGLMIYNLDDSCFNYYAGSQWILDCGATRELQSVRPRSFGSPGVERGYQIAVDVEGNRYISGEYNGPISLGSTQLLHQGEEDIFLTKLNPRGEILWALSIRSPNRDFLEDLKLDAQGNAFVIGDFRDTLILGSDTLTNGGDNDVFAAKISPSGQIIWSLNAGGAGSQDGAGIDIDPAGNVYLAGSFSGTAQFGPTGTLPLLSSNAGSSDMFLAKVDPNGQFVWAINAGGNAYDVAESVALDPAGNPYVGISFFDSTRFGNTTFRAGLGDVLVAKFDPAGNFLWANSAGGSKVEFLYDLSVDQNGDVYFGGFFSDTAYFGNDTLFAGLFGDGFVAKLSSNGQFIWSTRIGGDPEGILNGISLDALGNLYATGSVFDSVFYASDTLLTQGLDAFVAKLNANTGQYIWLRLGGGLDRDDGSDIAVDANGLLSITGSMKGVADFGGTQISSNGSNDFFLWTIDSQTGNNATDRVGLLRAQDGDSDASNELQNLSFTSPNLSLSNGNSVDLTPLRDNLGDHIATQNIQLGSNYLSGDGDSEGIYVNADGNVGIGTNSPQHPIDFGSGTGRRIALAQNSAGTDFYGFGISNSTLEIHAASTQNDDPAMVVRSSGNVGIGTTNPTRAKLEIGSFLPYSFSHALFDGLGVISPNQSGAANLSVYATHGVAALGFYAHSDARIKHIQGLSDGKADLNTLMQLEITDYRMKDTLTKGTDTIKKVIAQQVAEVYPQAVEQDITEVVPDIYQRAEMQDGWIMLATDLQVGERVKLISKQSAVVYEVSAVESGRFQVLDTAARNAPLSLGQAVFVYGREVDDFHTVDYEALSMLNVSATQEQQRIIEALKTQNKALEAEVKTLRALFHTFEARLQQLESGASSAPLNISPVR
ncbi:MAG: tail fiber domain-containing protein [Bacteroidota bacterium]